MQTRTHSPTRYHVFHDWFSIICTVFVPIYHWASMFFTFGSCLSFQYDNDQTCFFLWFFTLLCMCFNTLTQRTQHEKTCQNVIFLSLYIVFDVGSTFVKFHQVWNFFIFVITSRVISSSVHMFQYTSHVSNTWKNMSKYVFHIPNHHPRCWFNFCSVLNFSIFFHFFWFFLSMNFVVFVSYVMIYVKIFFLDINIHCISIGLIRLAKKIEVISSKIKK